MARTFRDARQLENGSQLATDICIVGAGAAGITLARMLTGKGLRVLLMESGSFDLEAATQRLYSGRSVGVDYYDLLACRLRYFGGTTNHWGGFCLMSEETDFTGTAGVPLSEWPLGLGDLSDHIRWSASMLGHDPDGFDVRAHLRAVGADEGDLVDRVTPSLRTRVFQAGKPEAIRFAQRFREELAQATDLDVFLNANLVKVQLDREGGQVTHLDFRTLTGRSFSVTARYFVLACHALENARQLLLARDVHPQGIGNGSGYVGRCFQEHPFLDSGVMVTNNAAFARLYQADLAKRFVPALTLHPAVLQRHGIMQYYCRFEPLPTVPEVKAALKRLWSKRNEPFDSEVLEQATTIAANMGGVVSHLYGAARGEATRHFKLEHRIEQTPSLDSRVVISDRLDDLGMPQLDLDWSLGELDLRTFEVGRETVVRELSAAGLGRFMSEPLTLDQLKQHAKGRFHHIGTTRMSDTAATGVVDKNLKVHEVRNLYLAGSSVFPRGGLPGPTMLLVAMARRLALHLQERVSSS